MKKEKKQKELRDSLVTRPFDSNVDMAGVITFVVIVMILALLVLTFTVLKFFG